ncbi:MAG: hypothetical protein WA584_06915 [Pyrinomonadaceae bacterium]
MAQEEAIREKEGDETGNVSVPTSSPPKLNLRRLESIQRVLQYASVLVLIVFIVLIAVSSYWLVSLNKQISENQNQIESQVKKKQELDEEIRGLQAIKDAIPKEQKEQIEKKAEKNIEQSPARIYIQIANEDQRKRANDIGQQLKSKGFIVPGIENVHDKAPNNSQLRTCNNLMDEATKKDLKDLTDALKTLSVTIDAPQFLSNCGKVNPRLYELWFGNNL